MILPISDANPEWIPIAIMSSVTLSLPLMLMVKEEYNRSKILLIWSLGFVDKVQRLRCAILHANDIPFSTKYTCLKLSKNMKVNMRDPLELEASNIQVGSV